VYKRQGEKVLAPQNGFVHEVYVKNGEYITTGTPLYSIVVNKRMVLQAMVRQSQMAELSKINDATIELNSGEVLTLKELNGVIKSVAQSISEENYLLPVTIEVDYHENLVSGGFVNVYLKRTNSTPALLVPETALVEIQGLYFVYLQLTPEMFERQQVKIGATDGKQRVILSGLNGDERIVSKGAILVKLAAVSNTVDAHAGHVH
jgi:RND family efflux transporter MFP subunit